MGKRGERIRLKCRGCETEMILKPAEVSRLYCSRTCRSRHQARPEISCGVCGVRFIPKASNRLTCCSRECGQKHVGAIRHERARKQREARKIQSTGERLRKTISVAYERAVKRSRTCKACGGTYMVGDGQYRTACSKECLKARRAAKKREGRRRRREPKNDRKRARVHGVEYQPINRQRVYERDGWRCGICQRRIDPKLKHPHPHSVSLDHIIPMAAGGGHTYANVQAAHFMCNSRKADGSAGEQLLLLG